MDSLPIQELRGPIHAALSRSRRLILQAPTGSGKSTQVPAFILDDGLAGRGQVVVMQPRRLAARMLARYVARERGVPLGSEIGYQVRFDDCSGPRTRIKYETDGVVLRQLLSDPELHEVSVLVLDEFHERHLHADVMLGMVLRLQETCRPDLKVVIMSATLDTAALEKAIGPCAVLRSEGRQFPVRLEYLARPMRPDRDDVWDAAARETERMLRTGPAGDILVFMPGAYEIRRTVEAIRRTAAGRSARVLPLYGELRPEEQDAALARYAERKVVVATNVAETSLTIDGVTVVIDSGLARKARFDPYRGIDTLLIEKITRASADQRAGRAGRTAPGVCLRLWTEAEHASRPAFDLPEVQRVDLSEIILTLKSLGIGDLRAFPWLDRPDDRILDRGLSLLMDLGALSADGSLTELGRRLLSFPLHPREARMLVAAGDYGCVPSAALVAALTQERSIFMPRQNRDVVERRERVLGEEQESDFLLAMRAWRYAADRDFSVPACDELGISSRQSARVGDLYRQLLDIARGSGLPVGRDSMDAGVLGRCILLGFSDQVARRLPGGSGRCEMVHGRRGSLDADSVVRDADLLVAGDIQEIGRRQGEVEVKLSMLTRIEEAWLRDLFPGDLRVNRSVELDPVTRRVVAREHGLFRDLVLAPGKPLPPTEEEAARILAGEVLKGNLAIKDWDHRVEQWIARVNLVAEVCPDSGVTAITEADRRAMVEQICLGAWGYKDIKDRAAWPVVRGWLPGAQQAQVERLAPERLTLPNGRTPRLTYEPGKPPYVALRIQELYGVQEPLTILGGRQRVVVQVLAPNQRPVQITDDLGSFWKNHYERVKKELQRRYPKHEWR